MLVKTYGVLHIEHEQDGAMICVTIRLDVGIYVLVNFSQCPDV